jgi:hypothetical protein
MIKILPVIFIILVLNYSKSIAQCYSRNGIMNNSCKSLTIITPPAVGLSVGYSNTNILNVEIDYITKDELVYGVSMGIRPNKFRLINKMQEDASVNTFLGYNLAGCIIIGVTAGIASYTTYRTLDDLKSTSKELKSNIGISMKVISTYTSFPITFGCYGNKAEIGISIGTFF